MFVSVRKTLTDVQESLLDIRKWSGGPPGCPRVVGRPTRMSGSGRKTLWMSGSGREALQDVREWSGSPPG